MYNPPRHPSWPTTDEPKKITTKDRYRRAVFYIVIYLLVFAVYGVVSMLAGGNIVDVLKVWVAANLIVLAICLIIGLIVLLHDWAFDNND